MTENEIEIAAPPAEVWEVLANPHSYDEWVLGAQEVRDADDSWPTPGSKLHHRTGVGPLAVDDETEVVESDPPRRLVLRAHVAPFGEFRVVLELHPEPTGGTRLVMREEAAAGPAAHVPGVDGAIHARNAISLRQIKALAEETPSTQR